MAITIKAARVNANLTQAEAAKIIGVTADTVKNWESGKSCPTVEKLERLLEAYNVKYDDINFLPRNNA